MRNWTSDYGAARVCKVINLSGREAYTTVPNTLTGDGWMDRGQGNPGDFDVNPLYTLSSRLQSVLCLGGMALLVTRESYDFYTPY